MQNKQAYTPEVVRRIVWAIIVDTRSYFDDIKLAEDFMEQGQHLQFPVSTLEGDFIAIKHGIQIQRHNFPAEWSAPEPYKGPSSYYPMKGGGGGGYQLPPGVPSGNPTPVGPPSWAPPPRFQTTINTLQLAASQLGRNTPPKNPSNDEASPYQVPGVVLCKQHPHRERETF